MPCMRMIILNVGVVIVLQMPLHLHILQKHLDTKMYMYVQMVTEMMKTLMDGRKLTAVFMTRFLQKPKATAEITE